MDAWTIGLGVVTLGSLSYVSTGYTNAECQHTFRINMGKDDSFFGDLRFVGALTGLAIGMLPGMRKYQKSLYAVAGISAMSLASTEGIRYGLGQQSQIAPKTFQALPDWSAMWEKSPSADRVTASYAGHRNWSQQ